MSLEGLGRWEYSVVWRDSRLQRFWKDHLASTERRVLFVMGRGFDPRTAIGVDLVVEANRDARIDVVGLEFRAGPVAASGRHLYKSEKNWGDSSGEDRGKGRC